MPDFDVSKSDVSEDIRLVVHDISVCIIVCHYHDVTVKPDLV